MWGRSKWPQCLASKQHAQTQLLAPFSDSCLSILQSRYTTCCSTSFSFSRPLSNASKHCSATSRVPCYTLGGVSFFLTAFCIAEERVLRQACAVPSPALACKRLALKTQVSCAFLLAATQHCPWLHSFCSAATAVLSAQASKCESMV